MDSGADHPLSATYIKTGNGCLNREPWFETGHSLDSGYRQSQPLFYGGLPFATQGKQVADAPLARLGGSARTARTRYFPAGDSRTLLPLYDSLPLQLL
jgi:hypothetical protein